jgi:general stress protein 26
MTDSENTHDTLWDLIKKTRFGMLTHRDADGQLHSQPLTTQNRELAANSALYFFISRSSHLARRVAADGLVNIAYANTDDDCYVSVSGAARISDDRAMITQLWSPAAKAWFPGGQDDPDLALLAVQPDHAEYWNVKESKIAQVLKMAKAAITGKPPVTLGEHREVDLAK